MELRRWTALFTLPFAAVIALSGLAGLLWLPHLLGPRLGLAMSLLGALVMLALAASIGGGALQSLRLHGPALVVDAQGITDHFHLHAHLPWSDIESASLDVGDGNSLVLVLRPGVSLPGGGEVRPSMWRSAKRFFNGGDVSIPLGRLAYHPHRLRQALEAHASRAKLVDAQARRGVAGASHRDVQSF
jgi:hypothetical protein